MRIFVFEAILKNRNITGAVIHRLYVLYGISNIYLVDSPKFACKVRIIGKALPSNSFDADKIRRGEAFACFPKRSLSPVCVSMNVTDAAMTTMARPNTR